jgi:hypothetical protein
MKVTDKRQKPNTIDFADLDCGDVFQDEDGDICMKMDNGIYSSYNAVVLSTGITFKCEMSTPVTPLIAELVIKGEN